MSNRKIKEINLNDLQSLKDVLETLEHYPSHSLAVALIASSKIVCSFLQKNEISINDFLEKNLLEGIDDRAIHRLVYLFANSALDQYKSNIDSINNKFLSRTIH